MPYTVEEFGENIRRMRTAAGLTHADVEAISRRYGYPVTQPSQSKVETARSKGLPSGAILLGFSYAFNSTPSELLNFHDEEEKARPSRAAAQPAAPSTVTKIDEVLKMLPEEFQAQALQYVQYLNKLAALQRQRNAFYFKEVVELVQHLDPNTQKNFAAVLKNMGTNLSDENSGQNETGDPVAEQAPSDLVSA